MGLSAGQARLLTITARKSDCEYQSMRLSHQKIALSRELADLSNEYQNSLDQTKLIYDYYGTGDTSTPLSYNILMSPSTLNDYMPTILTDALNRVTLNGKYASAARFAGIPQEGLGTLPSEAMRQAFVEGLYNSGLISETLKDTIKGLPYNQAAGFGGDVTVAVQTQDVTFDELVNILNNTSVKPLSCNVELNSIMESVGYMGLYDTDTKNNVIESNSKAEVEGESSITLGDILSGDYVLWAQTGDCGQSTGTVAMLGGVTDAIINSSFWDTMFDTFESLFDTGDAYTQSALEYARVQMEKYIDDPRYDENGDIYKTNGKDWDYLHEKTNEDDSTKWNSFNVLKHNSTIYIDTYSNDGNNKVKDEAIDMADSDGEGTRKGLTGYIGIVAAGHTDSGDDEANDCRSTLSVNLSTMMKAYLTYFYDFLNGVSTTDIYGMDEYCVNDTVKLSSLIDEDTVFTISTGNMVSSDDVAQATFYDALFNQICANGWTENDNINDTEYLQQMLQNGMLFISKSKDDGYYYQGNYATDPYIKEISDDTLVAQAEAKYTTEKAKLNSKEETLDMKMKNLDTEISSLTTEYDTVKNTISKNIEKSFKRYNA